MLLWFDFHVNNPRNPDVRGVGRREIKEIFPGCDVCLLHTTLLPPVAKRLAPCSLLLCEILAKIPLLCTHYVGAIQRQSHRRNRARRTALPGSRISRVKPSRPRRIHRITVHNMMHRRRKVALFLPNLHAGGAERITVHLANGLCERGEEVELVMLRAEGPFLAELKPQIGVVSLSAGRVASGVPRLARYLRSARPGVLLSALDHANVGAIVANRISATQTPVVVAVHVTHSMDAAHRRGVKQTILHAAVRWTYRRAAAIVCVSQGVADDLIGFTGVDPRLVRVIYNPVITPRLGPLSRAPLAHPWFAPARPACSWPWGT